MVVMAIKYEDVHNPHDKQQYHTQCSGMIRSEGIVGFSQGQGWSGVVVMVIKCIGIHNPHVKQQYHPREGYMSRRDCRSWSGQVQGSRSLW
jgi:hypothetical protein